MRLALITQEPAVDLAAAADGTGPRISRAEKALAHCKDEWTRAYALAKGKGQPPAKALRMATVAYKLAMPNLDSLAAIKAAVACIAQGIRLEVFDGRDGSQLLYAAQVALALQSKNRRKS